MGISAKVAANKRQPVNATLKSAIGIGLVMLLAGCNDRAAKEQQHKMAQLETRLSTLESNTAMTDTNLDELRGHLYSNEMMMARYMVSRLQMDATNDDTIQKFAVLADHFILNESNLFVRVQQLENPTNRGARPAVPARPLPAPAMRDGVPIAIYTQITSDAVKKWPGNYEMQAYEIKNQVEAYRQLHP
jgi:uncharacterized coiled-coil protein SlyX